jgi:hypothetical protein
MEHHFRRHLDLSRQNQVVSHVKPILYPTDFFLFQHQLDSLYRFSSCFSLLFARHEEDLFSLVI